MNKLDQRLDLILAAVQDRLDTIGAPVVRAFIAPGLTAPWDTCCNDGNAEGQTWVAVNRYLPTTAFPLPNGGAAGCGYTGYGAELTIGVLRCAQTVDDNGVAPSAEQVTADARKVGRDRQAVLDALMCDLFADADADQVQLGQWVPLGPDGGCVGGSWTVTIAVPKCDCVED